MEDAKLWLDVLEKCRMATLENALYGKQLREKVLIDMEFDDFMTSGRCRSGKISEIKRFIVRARNGRSIRARSRASTRGC